MKKAITLCALICLCAFASAAMGSTNYAMELETVAGGGTGSVSENYAMDFTVGFGAGMSSTTYNLCWGLYCDVVPAAYGAGTFSVQAPGSGTQDYSIAVGNSDPTVPTGSIKITSTCPSANLTTVGGIASIPAGGTGGITVHVQGTNTGGMINCALNLTGADYNTTVPISLSDNVTSNSGAVQGSGNGAPSGNVDNAQGEGSGAPLPQDNGTGAALALAGGDTDTLLLLGLLIVALGAAWLFLGR
ncbi:MAG: hypothetical protein V1676_03850 [Candidatus Diapherotrites archaeon]